jgi:hypothetical protein
MAFLEGVGVSGKLTKACFWARFAREDRIRGFGVNYKLLLLRSWRREKRGTFCPTDSLVDNSPIPPPKKEVIQWQKVQMT